jgi:ankyrin repeat protein
MTPLHWAAQSGDARCVELLLRYGADVSLESKFDKTPLEIASDKGDTDVYEMLLVIFVFCCCWTTMSRPRIFFKT